MYEYVCQHINNHIILRHLNDILSIEIKCYDVVTIVGYYLNNDFIWIKKDFHDIIIILTASHEIEEVLKCDLILNNINKYIDDNRDNNRDNKDDNNKDNNRDNKDNKDNNKDNKDNNKDNNRDNKDDNKDNEDGYKMYMSNNDDINKCLIFNQEKVEEYINKWWKMKIQ